MAESNDLREELLEHSVLTRFGFQPPSQKLKKNYFWKTFFNKWSQDVKKQLIFISQDHWNNCIEIEGDHIE